MLAPVIKLQRFKVPGVAWFVILAGIMYLAPYILQTFWAGAPAGLAEFIVLLCGTLMRTIDIKVRPDDREQLIELIRQQQAELTRLNQPTVPATPTTVPGAKAAEPVGPVMRGAKPAPVKEPTVAHYRVPGAVGYETILIEPPPSQLTHWFWG